LQYISGHVDEIVDIIVIDVKNILSISNSSIQIWSCHKQLIDSKHQNNNDENDLDKSMWKMTYSETRKTRKIPLMCSRLKKNGSITPKIYVSQKSTVYSNMNQENIITSSDNSIIKDINDEKDEEFIKQNITWVKRLYKKIKRKYQYGFVFVKEIADDREIGTCAILVTETCIVIAKDCGTHIEFYFTNSFSQAIQIEDNNNDIIITANFKDSYNRTHYKILNLAVTGTTNNWVCLTDQLKQFVDDIHPGLNFTADDVMDWVGLTGTGKKKKDN